MKTLSIAFGIVIMLSGSAPAEDCLDVQVDGLASYNGPLITDWQWAQVVTCIGGGVLSRLEADVESQASPPGFITFELRTTTAGLPDTGESAVLATGQVDVATIIGASTIALDLTGLEIEAQTGDTFALVLITTTPGHDALNCVNWLGGVEAEYTGGDAYYRTPWTEWLPATSADTPVDLNFRTYFDCSTPVEARAWAVIKSLYAD